MVRTYEGFISDFLNNPIYKIKKAFTIGELSKKNDDIGEQILNFITENKFRIDYSIVDTNHKFHIFDFMMKFRKTQEDRVKILPNLENYIKDRDWDKKMLGFIGKIYILDEKRGRNYIIDGDNSWYIPEDCFELLIEEDQEKKIQVVGEEGHDNFLNVQISVNDVAMKIKESLKIKIYSCFIENKLKLGTNVVDSITDEWW